LNEFAPILVFHYLCTIKVKEQAKHNDYDEGLTKTTANHGFKADISKHS
jgi:hypothetical protein